MFTHALRGRGIAAEEVAELLDETSQELRFSRQLLQATMENVSQGIAVADAEARIVAWNRRYLEMFDYPEGMVYVGRPVADLIRWNAERGEFGNTDPEAQVDKRLAHMRAGTRVRDPARATQRPRLRDPRPAACRTAATSRTFTDITDYKRDRAGAARGQADARAARRGAHARAAARARGAARRQAARRGGQRHQDALRRGGEPRPAAAAQCRAAVRLGARGTLDRPRRARDRRAASTARCAPPRKCSTTCSTSRDSRAARCAPRSPTSTWPRRSSDLERQFAPLAARRGLRLRVTRPALPRAQRPRAAASRAAEPDLERAALHAARRRAGRLPAPRRLGRAEVWDTGPGIPEPHQRAIFDEFRRLDRPSPWGEQGLGLGLVDLRPHRAAARHANSACARGPATARCSACACRSAARRPPSRSRRSRRHRPPRHRASSA